MSASSDENNSKNPFLEWIKGWIGQEAKILTYDFGKNIYIRY